MWCKMLLYAITQRIFLFFPNTTTMTLLQLNSNWPCHLFYQKISKSVQSFQIPERWIMYVKPVNKKSFCQVFFCVEWTKRDGRRTYIIHPVRFSKKNKSRPISSFLQFYILFSLKPWQFWDEMILQLTCIFHLKYF